MEQDRSEDKVTDQIAKRIAAGDRRWAFQTDRSSSEPRGKLGLGAVWPGDSVIGGRAPDGLKAVDDGVCARAAAEAGMGRTEESGVLPPRAALENAANEPFEIMRRTVPPKD